MTYGEYCAGISALLGVVCILPPSSSVAESFWTLGAPSRVFPCLVVPILLVLVCVGGSFVTLVALPGEAFSCVDASGDLTGFT